MSTRRNSPLLEAAEALAEYRHTFQEKQQRKLDEAAKEREAIEEKVYFGTKEKKEATRRVYQEFASNLKDELYGDALKVIYISALREGTALTDGALVLANNMVENFIKESGGANAIMNKTNGKTYALDIIQCMVEGTYRSIMEDVDKEDEESMEVPEEKKEEMYDDMSKDEEITSAVETIAKRITDAEEEFIRKNNEDKKTLEDIATKFSERIKQVEGDPEAAEEEQEEVQEESTRLANRYSKDHRNNRTKNVFEQVVVNLTESIIRDEKLREEYTENGRLDIGSVIESAKCIYGFLETVNTLQIHRVDAKYIQEALSTM